MLKRLASGAALLIATAMPLHAGAQTTLTIEDALDNVLGGLEACIRAQVADTAALVDTLTTLECVDPAYNVVSLFGIDQFFALQSLAVRQQDLGPQPALDDVARLAALTTLDLSTNQIEDISDLAGMTGLTELRVARNSLSGDLAATLATLTALEVLNLENNKITSVGLGPGSGVAALASLRELYITDNQIDQLPSLQGLDGLTTLQASFNRLDTDGIATLAELVDNGLSEDSTLKTLHLNENRISSIDVIDVLAGLENLQASDNLLTDIGVVASLDALQTLFIDNFNPAVPNNTVSSLASLDGAGGNLLVLIASGNQLTDVTGLGGQLKLVTLWLDNNRINDLSALIGQGKLPALTDFDLSSNYVQGFFDELLALPQASVILLFDNPLICGDIVRYEGASGGNFLPTPLYGQTQPIGPDTVCSDDDDGDRFGADRASLTAFPIKSLFDQFPDDVAASVDTDGDQCPDAWNTDKTEADSTTGLSLDAPTVVNDGRYCIDDDGDRVGPDGEGGAPVDPDDTDPDTDDDGLEDGEELFGENENGFVTDPTKADTDNDGLEDPDELFGTGTGGFVTNPTEPDTDSDGLTDGQEVQDPDRITDPTDDDTDDDRLLDGAEVLDILTSPLLKDTDGDGFDDGDEVDFETNPLDPDDIPSSGLNIPLFFRAIQQTGP